MDGLFTAPVILDISDIIEDNAVDRTDHQVYISRCLQFITYSMKIYRAKNKHATNATRVLMIKNLVGVLYSFVYLYKHIDIDPARYRTFLGENPTISDTIKFIHLTILASLRHEFKETLDRTEHIYTLTYNYRHHLKEHGISATDAPINEIKDYYGPAYSNYRFIKKYGKVKSSKAAFKDALFQLEIKRMCSILDDSNEECAICCEPCDEDYFVTVCYHVFHKNCMTDWYKSCWSNNVEYTCPMCKTNLSSV
jgi:hypothetical protein